jgi:hypothetical protein
MTLISSQFAKYPTFQTFVIVKSLGSDYLLRPSMQKADTFGGGRIHWTHGRVPEAETPKRDNQARVQKMARVGSLSENRKNHGRIPNQSWFADERSGCDFCGA